MRRTLRRLGVSAERLDDAVQDVFEVLVRRIHDYDARYEPQRWLWGISRRVAWKHRGQAQRSDRVVELSPGGAAVQANVLAETDAGGRFVATTAPGDGQTPAAMLAADPTDRLVTVSVDEGGALHFQLA